MKARADAVAELDDAERAALAAELAGACGGRRGHPRAAARDR